MKPSFRLAVVVLVCTIFPSVYALGQNFGNEKALGRKIHEARKLIDTFQAFGALTQEGPLFDPEPIKPGERTDWSKQKFVYIAFQNADGRMSERKFTEEEMQKPDRHTVVFYSSKLSKSIYYGSAGMHLARYLVGGRYVYEDESTSIAFPAQTLGFWVSEEKKWPDELLESGRYRIVGERKSAKFHTVIDIKGKTENNHPTRFTVAPDFGYRVVEAETQDDNFRYQAELESVVKVNGEWCPKRFKRTINSRKGYPSSIQAYDFDKIIVNKAGKGDILFSSVTGDHNHNLRTNNSSYTLPDGSRKYVTLSQENQPFLSPIGGWLYFASITTLLVLTVGAYIKWKRTKLSKSA